MKAARFETFGSAADTLIVGDWEMPAAGAGEVLVKLFTSGVNPSDVKKRAGAAPTLLDNGPVIPHSDGAGIIEAVGEGVSKVRIGERVWVYNAQYGRRFGTAAEYVSLPASQVVALPDNTDFATGACIGIPMMTAHRCVSADGSVAGKCILVTGGAGRVGYYAIQMAKILGATVIATASNEKGQAQCRAAGADFVTGHPTKNSVKQIQEFTEGKGVDRVIEGEFGANLVPVLDVLKTSGVIATYSSMIVPEPQLPFRRMMFMDLTLRLVLVYAMPEKAKQDAISDITTFLKSNQLQHRIVQQLPLAQIASAHEMIETGNQFGCVILQCQ